MASRCVADQFSVVTYAFGWFSLYDEPPNGPDGRPGDEMNWGLLDWRGRRKPFL